MATMTNNATISFPTPNGDWLVPTHFAVFEGSSATIGSTLAMITGTLSSVSAPAANDTVEFASGQLTITLTGNELTEKAWKSMANLVRAGFSVSLHTGTPTSANELSGANYGRASTSRSQWTVA